jgi:hypothetical protein
MFFPHPFSQDVWPGGVWGILRSVSQTHNTPVPNPLSICRGCSCVSDIVWAGTRCANTPAGVVLTLRVRTVHLACERPFAVTTNEACLGRLRRRGHHLTASARRSHPARLRLALRAMPWQGKHHVAHGHPFVSEEQRLPVWSL